MKDDASPQELENLLREALNNGLETPRGVQPIHQLKTVPMQVQSEMLLKIANPQKAVSKSQSKSPPALAPKLAPDSVRPAPPRRPRKSVLGLAAGLVALSAICGGFWVAQNQGLIGATPSADITASTALPVTENGSEGVVGITASRAPATMTMSPVAPPAPPTLVVMEAPKIVMTPPPAVVAPRPEPRTEPKPVEVKSEPKTARTTHTTHVAPAPVAKSEPKAEPGPKAEKKEAAPAPGGSVDALLQQQLKGAIP